VAQNFATAAKGTEGAVRDELREHRFRGVRATRGGVSFEGGIDEGYRACLVLRTPVRVLREVACFDAPSGDDLYEGARAIEWEEHISPRTTIAVRASCRSSALTHTQRDLRARRQRRRHRLPRSGRTPAAHPRLAA
jgi:putative N6-adenine-specific DNA methylase